MIELAPDNHHAAPPCGQPAGLPAHGLADGVCSFRQGLNDAERAILDHALAIVGRHLRARVDLYSPAAVRAYLNLQLGAEPIENFAALYLDAQHRGIAFEVLARGTLTQAMVYPRELVHAALKHQAAAVVLAHNHPSGSVTPSRADEAITQTIKAALALIDVRVLDHFIVNGREARSMAEEGLL